MNLLFQFPSALRNENNNHSIKTTSWVNNKPRQLSLAGLLLMEGTLPSTCGQSRVIESLGLILPKELLSIFYLHHQNCDLGE